MRFWCAECGTDSAGTYVVTFVNGQDDDSGRTEVCRACDDELRCGPSVMCDYVECGLSLAHDGPHQSNLEGRARALRGAE